MTDDIWDNKRSVYITSFWGWSPETWGTVGFTGNGRRLTIVRETTDPFIMIVYVTKNAPNASRDLLGKIVGFYLVSHIQGDRDEFTHTIHHTRNPDKWRYSLKALRAFSFLPEYRLPIEAFDPTMPARARAVAAYGEELDETQIKRLKLIPYVEVPIFGGTDFVFGEIHVPDNKPHKVKAGPINRTGYTVGGEPLETEKELYTLELKGDTSSFLGRPTEMSIFKVGLSISPKTRLESFSKTLPLGAYAWHLSRTTRRDGHDPYPCFEAAEAGENAMKDYLGKLGNNRWLGGEFYAATAAEIDHAWQIGREAALAYLGIR